MTGRHLVIGYASLRIAYARRAAGGAPTHRASVARRRRGITGRDGGAARPRRARPAPVCRRTRRRGVRQLGAAMAGGVRRVRRGRPHRDAGRGRSRPAPAFEAGDRRRRRHVRRRGRGAGGARVVAAPYSSGLRSSRCTAGPWSTSPSGAKREPWHGQSQLRSARFQLTWQPRWLQLVETATSVPSSRRWPATFSPAWRTMSPSPGASDSIGRVPRFVIRSPTKCAPTRAFSSTNRGAAARSVDAVGVEQLGPRVVAAEHEVGEQHRRGGAARHAPLGEAGRHQHLLRARREPADVRDAVDGRVVLRGPAVLDGLDVPVLAREPLEPRGSAPRCLRRCPVRWPSPPTSSSSSPSTGTARTERVGESPLMNMPSGGSPAIRQSERV